MSRKESSKQRKIIKIVYFDEMSATDYITIQNGGQIDWSTTENKEKLAKLLAEIDA
jgi:penicillin-binding protein-related factor A (putative recombinase)